MFAEIFGKIEVFIRKEIIMKKGILNEVNEIRRAMGLVNEQSNNQNKEEVLKIQKALNKVWNNVKIKEDGIMGNETIKYIKQFQKENNLEVVKNTKEKSEKTCGVKEFLPK